MKGRISESIHLYLFPLILYSIVGDWMLTLKHWVLTTLKPLSVISS